MTDSSTKTAFIDIFLDDCYGLTYFKKMIPGLGNIIDVGANQGLFVLHARNIFPLAAIDAYEPNDLVISNLTNNAKATNARVFNEAVGLSGGMISMLHGHDTLHGKTLSDEPGTIVQTSIRDCIDRLPANSTLLKLDCEGAEWEIIKDHEAMKSVEALTMEYHLDDQHLADHHNRHETISTLLEDLGFKITRHTRSGIDYGMAWAIRK